MNAFMSRGVVLVEYFFTDTRLLAFIIRPELEQPKIVAIDTPIARLRDDIREEPADPDTKWREVLARPSLVRCIEPILEWTEPGEIICLVPSGELFYVPMHAISAGDAPLIVRNPVFYAPSASALRYCVRRRDVHAGSSRKTAVFGNPAGDLDSAEQEATAVAGFLGTTAVVGVNVTRKRWFEAMASSDIIHFAGHAEFSREDPLASCLYLADDDPVTARDLFASAGASLRLITLSGCETGVNEIHPGDELLGLTRALLYAGASSLLLTLWPLHDPTAILLMRKFYNHWLNGNELKVDALRNAQMEILAEGITDPHFWAPFVLIGDWA